jgi:tetratricopeptide (TPR) repeat protein
MLNAFSVYEKNFGNTYDDGRRFEVLIELGNIYSRIKDYPEAHRAFLRAAQISNRFASASIGHQIESAACLAKSYLALGQRYIGYLAGALLLVSFLFFNDK